MARWAPRAAAEIIAVPIDPQHFNQLIAELAELIYNDLSDRQLAPCSSLLTDPSAPHVLDPQQCQRTPLADRTGSHD